MAIIALKKGLAINLPAKKTPGTVYVTTDERAVYLDIDDTTRIRLGGFQSYATPSAPGADMASYADPFHRMK